MFYSLTDQGCFLRWKEHVDMIWVNTGRKILIAVGQSDTAYLKLPSIDVEVLNIRVGADGGDLPGDVSFVSVWVGCKPVEGASTIGALGIGRLKSKAVCDGSSGRLAAENPTDDASVESIGGPARSQAKQTRDLTSVDLRSLVGRKD